MILQQHETRRDIYFVLFILALIITIGLFIRYDTPRVFNWTIFISSLVTFVLFRFYYHHRQALKSKYFQLGTARILVSEIELYREFDEGILIKLPNSEMHCHVEDDLKEVILDDIDLAIKYGRK